MSAVLTGKLVQIVDANSADFRALAAMELDYVLGVLDPPVGVCEKPSFYSIYTRSTDELIGICSIYNYVGSAVEFGIRIWNRDCWNKGYGSEATNLMCDWIFEKEKGVRMIVLKTPKTNIRAYKSYVKCGFEQIDEIIVEGIQMIRMRKIR